MAMYRVASILGARPAATATATATATAMLSCAMLLGAQTPQSSQLRVFVMPAYDQQSWALARALNRDFITSTNVAELDSAAVAHMWATGGAIADGNFTEPVNATRGYAASPYDRRTVAQYFHAEVLIALVPDSLRPDSAINVLISTRQAGRMSDEGRYVGTWVITNMAGAAKSICKAIEKDTAFQRLKKEHK